MSRRDQIRKRFAEFLKTILLISCVVLVSARAANLGAGANQEQRSQLGPSTQTEAGDGQNDDGGRGAEIYLEGIDDLDHLSYLAMRNYNLTDERLLQSTWLTGGSQLETGPRAQDDSATGSMAVSEPNNRLALMLESLMLHLKNGHLHRMSLDELEQIVIGRNLTESLETMRKRRFEFGERRAKAEQQLRAPAERSGSGQTPAGELGEGRTGALPSPDQPDRMDIEDDSELRCLFLVTLYKFDLGERARAQTASPVFPSNLQPSKPDDESPLGPSSSIQSSDKLQAQTKTVRAEEWRLVKLCKLAVNCHSSEELVDLISRPWRSSVKGPATSGHAEPVELQEIPKERASGGGGASSRDQLERESSVQPGANSDERSEPERLSNGNEDEETHDESNMRLRHRKSLRDSVSLSLAKLCPLILFPLHEDDGQCMVRRDDRPPMVRVWAFATLFVTIVCFCSLIGLSITPLIGHSATDFAADSADSTGPAVFRYLPNFLFGPRSSPTANNNDRHSRHRASLTLFEGLAVGSLVGSALFSLLPQAFELQERESNQSFLLKAFIIFSGIYLFFLSERIMRIILDTRQKRKRKKRLITHRSSTTAAAEMPHTHQRYLVANSPAHRRNHSQRSYQQSLTSTGLGQGSLAMTSTAGSVRQNSMSQSRPSTSSLGSGVTKGARQRSSALVAHATDTGKAPRSALRLPKSIAECEQLDPNSRVPFQGVDEQRSSQMKKHKKSLTAMPTTDDDFRQQRDAPLSADADQMRAQRKQTRTRPTGKQQSRARRRIRASKQGQQNRKPSNGTTFRSRARAQNQPAERARRGKQLNKPGRQDSSAKLQAGDHKRTRVALENSTFDGHNLYPHQLGSSSPTLSYFSSSSSCSSSPSSSSSSFSSYVFHETGRSRLASDRNGVLANAQASDSQMGYSNPSDSDSLSLCSSCPAYASEYCAMLAHTNNLSDSDDDNDQRRAVTKRMSELTHHRMSTTIHSHPSNRKSSGQDNHHQQQVAVGLSHPRTTFEFSSLEPDPLLGSHDGHDVAQGYCAESHWFDSRKKNGMASSRSKQRDISTVAWMIILGDGLHNFIDGISIGAAFSESILSGISISVAVICEEFPHELGDFAVLISSGMTIRQALGYNFLSACTCYFGMAVGIILGDVTDGASYISALAAGVFLYIALVDMMGELSAALESSSRYSIARTLKLLLLQNVGIAIGISIIFVLSFIDF